MNAPPQTSLPSEMTQDAFVAQFGGVFEHSRWIAERAYPGLADEDCDSAEGLHRLLCSVFQTASDAEKRGVLTAHPDLAGRLALAGHLTGESTKEQASAGLDSLSESELQVFTELNDRYTSKFHFPFIMAVKGRNKDEILAAFKSRVENNAETEFTTACGQVERIALLRLKDMLP
ncbi:2-oxo-4-hydroxy-4-carboxy-5-ureidoimidazoline decarboxylase [Denitrobaculum tricleocarpae]|uniref:2-oxo-4-hydroxy-4-carboxy-5-ureidoimidazoline decarboxylase n=1 Tax=Denitrobaculum tricleocarpae TaxID=2591009 RepID=A0A545TG72_9PROT|nr:2-oxo-4-hydroxy-4-carboxy-5-ureidoimidazoline decarboxylase [Denitrobaculum tricleocarpae]TQV76219.1 2-oxo-4-hydroxy-4-carboxy-5-ureidoimidazoline decarboxylase [Denitrobaculum tricleocarpae]